VYDGTNFENHEKTVLSMKDTEFIKEKSNDMMSNSYKEFGIHNVFSKIELLGIYEKETKKGSTMMTQHQPKRIQLGT